MDKIKSWVISNKLEFLILLFILLLGAFLRLYKIDQYMTFLGDEGRDVIIVRRLLTELHPPLIGPGTSIGNMYLGPAYYYMMAIPLLLANYNPVGPAIFIALLGIMTIFFVWYVAREWFGKEAAIISSSLYAVSPVIIIYSRSSWNPNIMPFFALLAIYCMWRVWVKKEFKLLWVVGFSLAMCLQSHYLALLLIPTILIVWLMTFLKSNRKKALIIYSFISLIVFLALMSPLAFFDIRHNFINFKAIKAFFTDRQTTVSVLPWKAIPQMWPILNNVVGDLVGAKNMGIGILVSGVLLFSLVFKFLVKREKYDFKKLSKDLIIFLWLGFGLIGLALYKQHIYSHYFGFIFPVPFLIIGQITQFLVNKKNRIFLLLLGIGVISILYIDLQNTPIASPANKQLERAEVVSKKVEEISEGNKFNFAIIAENNYDSAYRYFLNLDNAKVTDIDPGKFENTVTNQLIVVCERPKDKCDPTHNPKAEVANFGWSKILSTWNDVFGVTIYKLGHTK